MKTKFDEQRISAAIAKRKRKNLRRFLLTLSVEERYNWLMEHNHAKD